MLNVEDGRQKHEALHFKLEKDERTFYELVRYEQADLIQNSCAKAFH